MLVNSDYGYKSLLGDVTGNIEDFLAVLNLEPNALITFVKFTEKKPAKVQQISENVEEIETGYTDDLLGKNVLAVYFTSLPSNSDFIKIYRRILSRFGDSGYVSVQCNFDEMFNKILE